MKILANENFPRPAVERLRQRGHDVFWARTEMPGAEDDVVLERAPRDGRLVVTFDRDFGELAFYRGLPAACGVVLFRIQLRSVEWVTERVVTTLESPVNWAGQFVVVEDGRTRSRPLPSVGGKAGGA
jgi:predicted nuclease of predicted toxin-antitoxin system